MEAVRFTRVVSVEQAVGTMQLAHIAGPAGTMQGARIIGIAAATGEAIIGIRTMDIPGSAITGRAMAIHTTGLAITVTGPVGTIRTHTTIILIPTDTRCI
jgi:hypothetical protein